MIRDWVLNMPIPEPGSLEQESTFGPWFIMSHSQLHQHQKCPRRWWLHRNQAWQGWDRKASHAERLAYRCSKMSGLHSLSGSILHQMIYDLALRIGDLWPLFEDAYANPGGRGAFAEAAFRIWSGRMRRGVEAALDEEWSVDLKRSPPIAEIYYRDEEPWQDKGKRLKLHVRGVFDRFFELPWLRLIHPDQRPIGDYRWEEGADEGGKKTLNKVRVGDAAWWVIRDVVARYPNQTEILDVKSGRPKPEDAEQMHLYMVATAEQDQIPISAVTGRLLYLRPELGENAEVVLTLRDEGAAEAIKTAAAEGTIEIQSKLTHPWVNHGRREDFPMKGYMEAMAAAEDLEAARAAGEAGGRIRSLEINAHRRAETCKQCEFFECCFGTRDMRGILRTDMVSNG